MGALADELERKSRRDDEIIVGSEIRAALRELREEKYVHNGTHTCPCGKHQNPGAIIARIDSMIVVRVETPSYVWIELRRPLNTEYPCGAKVCEEVLLTTYREEKSKISGNALKAAPRNL